VASNRKNYNQVEVATEIEIGSPVTIGDAIAIIKGSKEGTFNRWFTVEEAQKLTNNLYLALFDGKKHPDFENWDKIVAEIEDELETRQDKGENWSQKTLVELEGEVARAWEEADGRTGEEARREGKALNAKQLEGLLRDLDDHLVEQGQQDQAVEKLLTKYQIKDDVAKKLVREAIGRKIEIQRQLESELVKKGVNEIEAKRIADAGSDAAALARKRLSNEISNEAKLNILEEAVARSMVETEVSRDTLVSRTNGEVKRIIGDQAKDIEGQINTAVEDAVAEVTIKTQLGDKPKVAAVALENEKILRPILGEAAAEVTIAALAGNNWKDEVDRIVPDPAKRTKIERELSYSKAVVEMIDASQQRAQSVANQMAEILEIEDSQKIKDLTEYWEQKIEQKFEGKSVLVEPVIIKTEAEGSKTISGQAWTEAVEDITGTTVTPTQKGKMVQVLVKRDLEINNFLSDYPKDLAAWKNFEAKSEAVQSLAIANPGASEEQITNGAEVIANINHPKTDLRAGGDTHFWTQLNQVNETGGITPQRAAEIGVIRNILVSSQPVDQWLTEFNQKTGGLNLDQVEDVHAAAANNVRNILGQNPEMVKFMESARLRASMAQGVQNWLGQRIAKIPGLQNFGLKLSNSTGFSLNFAKDAAGVLSKTGFGAEGIKGVLGLVGGKGAGGLITGIATKLGLSATGVGLLVVGVQIGGAIIGKLFNRVTDFIHDKVGIDLKGLTNIGGSIASGLGLKAALPGLVAKLGMALPGVGAAVVSLGGAIVGGVTTVIGGLAIGPILIVVVVGLILGLLLVPLLSTTSFAGTAVPPGRGVGGPVFDTATLPGGWLAPPPISVDPTLLTESCPQGFPMGGTITQGPNAPNCSHAGYQNTIDIAGNLQAVTATHQGIVTTAGWTDSGYGNYVDIAGKCNGTTYITRYAHLESIAVKQNDPITSGQTIGISDNTGNSTGPHIHYEVRGITWNLDEFNKYDRCCIGTAIVCPN
jgi:hypothetical protein